MKIYQIVSEAPTSSPRLVQDAGKWKWKLPDGTMLGGFSDQKAAMDWGKNNPTALNPTAAAAQKAATRQGRVDTAKTLAYNKANPVKGKLYSILGTDVKGKLTDKDLQKLRAAFLADKKYKQTALGKWESGKFGAVVRRALTVLQLAGSCIELYTVRAAADEYEQEGLLSPENAQIMRDYALRKFILEVSAQIAVWAASAALARALAYAVRGLMAVLGIATGGAALAGLVASEVAMQAFLAYIKTEDGREFFARYLAGVLIDDDSLVGSATGKILGWVGLATKVPGEKQKVSGLPASNNQTATA